MAARLRSVPWRRSPNSVRPLIVDLYFSRSRRPTRVLIGSLSSAWRAAPAATGGVCARAIEARMKLAINAAAKLVIGTPVSWVRFMRRATCRRQHPFQRRTAAAAVSLPAHIEQLQLLTVQQRPGARCGIAAANEVEDDVDVIVPIDARFRHPAPALIACMGVVLRSRRGAPPRHQFGRLQ